jgi:hypothetical protein
MGFRRGRGSTWDRKLDSKRVWREMWGDKERERSKPLEGNADEEEVDAVRATPLC